MRTTEKSSNKKKMANAISSMKNYFRNAVSKQRKRYTENGYNLDLAYICENIIAMGYPADNLEGIYRNRIDDVYQFLEETHPDNYKIYNLCSERSYDKNKFHGRVAVYPFTDHNPPTIELIQKFCDDIDRWLKSDEKNVAAVHCKAGKGRTGTMICCYLLHCGFKKTADDALGYYDEQRTKDKKGVTIPSQRRYVDYYSKLIRSGLPYQRQTLQLCKIRFSSAPLVQSQGSVLCSVSTLKDLSSPETVQILQTFAIDFRKTQSIEIKERIELTGDVKIELYQKVLKMKKFHFWFNTYFLNNQAVQVEDGDNINLVWELKKFELDAHKDKEHKVFAEDFTVQLILHPISSRNVCACNGNQQQNDNLFQQSQQQYTGQNQNHTTTNRNNHNNGSNSSFEYELEQQENQQQPDNQNMLQLYSTNNLILGNNTTTQQQNNQLHQKSHKLGPITNKFFDSSSVVVPTTKINPTNISGFPSDKNNINLKTTINKRQQHPLPPPSPPLHQQNLSSSVMPLSGTTTTNTTTSTIISSSIHKNHNINNSTINNSLNTSDSIIQSSSTNPTTTSSSMSGIKQLIDDDFNIDTISMKNKNSQNYLFNKTTNSSTTNNCSNVINQQQQHKDQHRQTTPSSINPDVSRTNSTSSNSSSSISSAASSSAVGEDWESGELDSSIKICNNNKKNSLLLLDNSINNNINSNSNINKIIYDEFNENNDNQSSYSNESVKTVVMMMQDDNNDNDNNDYNNKNLNNNNKEISIINSTNSIIKNSRLPPTPQLLNYDNNEILNIDNNSKINSNNLISSNNNNSNSSSSNCNYNNSSNCSKTLINLNSKQNLLCLKKNCSLNCNCINIDNDNSTTSILLNDEQQQNSSNKINNSCTTNIYYTTINNPNCYNNNSNKNVCLYNIDKQQQQPFSLSSNLNNDQQKCMSLMKNNSNNSCRKKLISIISSTKLSSTQQFKTKTNTLFKKSSSCITNSNSINNINVQSGGVIKKQHQRNNNKLRWYQNFHFNKRNDNPDFYNNIKLVKFGQQKPQTNIKRNNNKILKDNNNELIDLKNIDNNISCSTNYIDNIDNDVDDDLLLMKLNNKIKKSSNKSLCYDQQSIDSTDFYSSLCDRQLSFGTSPSKSLSTSLGGTSYNGGGCGKLFNYNNYGSTGIYISGDCGSMPSSSSYSPTKSRLNFINENPNNNNNNELLLLKRETPTIIAKPIKLSSIGFFNEEKSTLNNDEDDINKNNNNYLIESNIQQQQEDDYNKNSDIINCDKSPLTISLAKCKIIDKKYNEKLIEDFEKSSNASTSTQSSPSPPSTTTISNQINSLGPLFSLRSFKQELQSVIKHSAANIKSKTAATTTCPTRNRSHSLNFIISNKNDNDDDNYNLNLIKTPVTYCRTSTTPSTKCNTNNNSSITTGGAAASNSSSSSIAVDEIIQDNNNIDDDDVFIGAMNAVGSSSSSSRNRSCSDGVITCGTTKKKFSLPTRTRCSNSSSLFDNYCLDESNDDDKDCERVKRE